MKQPLYFHKSEGDEVILPHTYAIRQEGDSLVVGYAITHKNDQYCKAEGRKRAEKKMFALAKIPDEYFKTKNTKPKEAIVPLSIQLTIEGIIQRSGELLGIVGPTKVKTFASKFKTRVPIVDMVNIQPKTPSVTSEEVMGTF